MARRWNMSIKESVNEKRIKSFAECSMIWPQLAELCSLGAIVDSINFSDTCKQVDLQFNMDTTTGLDTILHNVLKFNLRYQVLFSVRFHGHGYHFRPLFQKLLVIETICFILLKLLYSGIMNLHKKSIKSNEIF